MYVNMETVTPYELNTIDRLLYLASCIVKYIPLTYFISSVCCLRF